MKYRVIYCDPPWRFTTYSQKGKGRSPEAHYNCPSFDSLRSLPVPSLAATDCALFLWVTDPLLPRGLELIEAWGFTYKTVGFYWAKLNKNVQSHAFAAKDFFTGMGYWTRANCEQCLFATRGAPIRKSRGVRKLIISPRREHSRKPDETRERIVRLLPGPYVELFARETHEGWDTTFSDEAGLFDEGHVETRRWSSDLT